MPKSESVPEVTELVFEFLERVDSSAGAPTTVLESLCEAWPSRAEPLRKAVSRLADTGLMSPVSPENDPADEDTFVGPYRLGRRLGSGGMGVVYLAWKDDETEPIALKLLRGDTQFDPAASARFEREVEVAARLDHPNIIRVLDKGVLPAHGAGQVSARQASTGQRFLAMEYRPGGTLDRVIGAFVLAGERPTGGADLLHAVGAEVDPLETPRTLRGDWWQVALNVTREIARGLAHAHDRGVVHRDVKPSNVFVTTEGRVMLLDFGLATLRGSGRLTVTGEQVGSLPYMSPEQVRGEAVSDERTDVYSLGVSAYELLTLELPYRGENPEQLALAISRGGAKRPSSGIPGLPDSVAAGIDAVLGCAMDVDPQRRYASVDAFAADLTAVIDGRPFVARPPTALVRTVLWMKHRPFVAATYGLVALLVIGVPATYGIVAKRRANVEREHSAKMERIVNATLGNFSSLITAVDGTIRGLTDGPLKGDPALIDARLEATARALAILAKVELDGADFLARDDPRAREAATNLRLSRARLSFSRGDALCAIGRVEEALASYAEHEKIYRALLEEEPNSVAALRALGSCLGQQHRAHRRDGTAGDLEIDLLGASVGYFERALAVSPDDYTMRSNLAAVHLMQAGRPGDTHRDAERLESIHAALGLLEPICQSPFVRGIDHRRLGEALFESARKDSAGVGATERFETLERAEAALQRALESNPHDAYTRSILSGLDRTLALMLDDERRDGEALTRATSARQRIEDLVAESSDKTVYTSRLQLARELESYLTAKTGDTQRGLSGLRESVEVSRRGERYGDDKAANDLDLATRLTNLANQLMIAEPVESVRLEEAEVCLNEAIEVMRSLAGPSQSHQLDHLLHMAIYNRAATRAKAGRIGDCRGDIDELEQLTADDDAAQLRFLADAYTELYCALLASGATEEPLDECRALVFDTLARAIDAGYSDRAELEATKALDPLRGDPRFRELLGEL